MSHDTDKLIRQLSLVAFLMAERRPVTAREIKSSVEGYQEMSDEAFARRFYSDRAELQALGVPLTSQRDEYTGEELYNMRSERYFLPELELNGDELAALQTALYLLEGKFAYAEPLRLALQNLALGRPGFSEAPTQTAMRVEVLDPEYSPEMQGRLEQARGGDLQAAHGQVPVLVDLPRRRARADAEPVRALPGRGRLVRRRPGPRRRRRAHLPRLAHPRRDPLRDAPRARLPAAGRASTSTSTAAGRRGRSATSRARPGWRSRATRRGGCSAPTGGAGASRTASSSRSTRAWRCSRRGCCARTAGPCRASPRSFGARSRARSRRFASATRRSRAAWPPNRTARRKNRSSGRPRPVAPERFAVLQALLAFLLDRCGEGNEAEIPAADLVERFHIPPEELEEHLSLLNLVNFGGGCYAVYAELQDDIVRVDKELFGDTFRAPPRLTPLEARAIRLALEFVGPMIAADARTPLERVRSKLEETFGEFELAQTPEPPVQRAEEDLVATLSRGANERRLVEVDYLKEGEDEVSTHLVEPYSLERRLPFWYVHTWDRTREGERSFRLDRMRTARIQRGHFEPREGFDPHEFRDARTARIWYSKVVARWEVEKGADPLDDGSAVAEKPVGSAEWLVGEILTLPGRSRRPRSARAQAGRREARPRAPARARRLASQGCRSLLTRDRVR